MAKKLVKDQEVLEVVVEKAVEEAVIEEAVNEEAVEEAVIEAAVEEAAKDQAPKMVTVNLYTDLGTEVTEVTEDEAQKLIDNSLTPKEFAALVKLTAKKLRRLTRKGLVRPAIKIRARWYFTDSTAILAPKAGEVEEAEEVEEAAEDIKEEADTSNE